MVPEVNYTAITEAIPGSHKYEPCITKYDHRWEWYVAVVPASAPAALGEERDQTVTKFCSSTI